MRGTTSMSLSDRGSQIGLLALVTSLTLVLASSVVQANAEAWRLDRSQDGIDVYTRPVTGSAVRAFKGTSEFDHPTGAVLHVLRDGNRLREWFPNCMDSTLLARDGSISFQYSAMAAPWPVSDRDQILRTEFLRDEATGLIELRMTAAPEHLPERPGRVRVQTAEGSWRLEPLGTGRSRVTFVMHLDPGGGVPQWLVNTRVVETPFEAIRNLRETVSGEVQ